MERRRSLLAPAPPGRCVKLGASSAAHLQVGSQPLVLCRLVLHHLHHLRGGHNGNGHNSKNSSGREPRREVPTSDRLDKVALSVRRTNTLQPANAGHSAAGCAHSSSCNATRRQRASMPSHLMAPHLTTATKSSQATRKRDAQQTFHNVDKPTCPYVDQSDQHTWRTSSLATPLAPTVMRTGSVRASPTSRSTLRGMVALNSSVWRSGRTWPSTERTCDRNSKLFHKGFEICMHVLQRQSTRAHSCPRDH